MSSNVELAECARRAIGVHRRINEIVLGKRAVTADTDLRLARYFGISEGFFLGLQNDFEIMKRKRELGNTLSLIQPRAGSAFLVHIVDLGRRFRASPDAAPDHADIGAADGEGDREIDEPRRQPATASVTALMNSGEPGPSLTATASARAK